MHAHCDNHSAQKYTEYNNDLKDDMIKKLDIGAQKRWLKIKTIGWIILALFIGFVIGIIFILAINN